VKEKLIQGKDRDQDRGQNLNRNLRPKKIGLTANFMYPDPLRGVYLTKTLLYHEQQMSSWILEEGAIPVLIPQVPALPATATGPSQNLAQAQAAFDGLMDELSGIIITGGSDLSPGFYGETGILDGKWMGDPLRDRYEKAVLDSAVERQIPLLGVCRGCQFLNAYFGGTLYQDLATQLPNSLTHRDPGVYDLLNHEVEFAENSLLKNLYGGQTEKKEKWTVNSVHHQGLKAIAPGFRPIAYSVPDRIVEAIESEKLAEHFVLGVQWHPEFSPSLREKMTDGQKLLNEKKLIKYFLSLPYTPRAYINSAPANKEKSP
jgi:putative glutamine amidotransferase